MVSLADHHHLGGTNTPIGSGAQTLSDLDIAVYRCENSAGRSGAKGKLLSALRGKGSLWKVL